MSPHGQSSLAVFLFSLCRRLVVGYVFLYFFATSEKYIHLSNSLSVSVISSDPSLFHTPMHYLCMNVLLPASPVSLFLSSCREPSYCLSPLLSFTPPQIISGKIPHTPFPCLLGLAVQILLLSLLLYLIVGSPMLISLAHAVSSSPSHDTKTPPQTLPC